MVTVSIAGCVTNTLSDFEQPFEGDTILILYVPPDNPLMTIGLDEGPPLPDVGPVQVQVNGPAPPDTAMEIEPLANPLQVGGVTVGIAVNTQGSMTTGCPEIEVRPQASVTLQFIMHGVLVITDGVV